MKTEIIDLAIATEAGVKTFTDLKEFMNWDKTENTKLIEEYVLIDADGNHSANKGINAGAYLYGLLENLGEWSVEMQFANENVPLINNANK